MKRKFDDDLVHPLYREALSFETPGCGAYTTAAIQYPLIGGTPTLIKLLIGAGCLMLPFVGSWILAGYCLRVTRNVMAGDYRLPEWDDFAGDFVRGLIAAIGMIVFGILTILSMLLIVTIPVAILFVVPMQSYAIARYAHTGDFFSFFDILGAYRAVFYRFGDAVMMSLGTFFTIVVFSMLIGIGTIFLIVPGLMASAALLLAIAFNAGVFGRATGTI